MSGLTILAAGCSGRAVKEDDQVKQMRRWLTPRQRRLSTTAAPPQAVDELPRSRRARWRMKADARSTLDMFPHPEHALRGADWGVLFDQKSNFFPALLSHDVAHREG
jgi:hypothetical protein